MEAGAAELGVQLAHAVAMLESPAELGPVKAFEENGESAERVSTDADDEDCRQTKRWSRAPLLPDFDFSSASSDSNPLFDTMTDEPTTPASNLAKELAATTSVVSDLRQAATQAQTATTLISTDAGKCTYRCSIQAQNSASHLAVERACREIIKEAGGRILDLYSFPGGFLFWIPPDVPGPITTCELPARGVRIELEKWTEFPPPKFDGLRMNPPSPPFNDEWLVARSEAEQVGVIDSVRSQSKAERRVQTWNKSLLARQRSKRKQSQGTPTRQSTVKEPPTSSKGTTEELRRCLPASRENILSMVGSLETIRRCAHEESGATENVSVTPRSAGLLRGNSDHRFTIVSDIPDSDEESGSEEWESVRSELDG